ncbi:hypothetical protein N482_19545 [Pseudoalteromonas luteoviolacea NCIMB 1942]|uniref:Uncharacterized protein n=1 Tax=Pseudoalteromonas luteoviolacea NCIMB 1942 TaxID=1365253 RepID=A0A166YM17_9GAMM|nr:hypothetical protein N482_19545 [Pseudoalteromonas luteoviolacea NCIMB 1942]
MEQLPDNSVTLLDKGFYGADLYFLSTHWEIIAAG